MTSQHGRSEVRWNALDGFDPRSPMIVPRNDLLGLVAERDRYKAALERIVWRPYEGGTPPTQKAREALRRV